MDGGVAFCVLVRSSGQGVRVFLLHKKQHVRCKVVAQLPNATPQAMLRGSAAACWRGRQAPGGCVAESPLQAKFVSEA